jgi:hypothetical protein
VFLAQFLNLVEGSEQQSVESFSPIAQRPSRRAADWMPFEQIDPMVAVL